ncbi:MAG: hypothetical protein OSJ68_05365, partial [Clostridia bacterium]|nr:hypothetical protein [Clostridia bacterium]
NVKNAETKGNVGIGILITILIILVFGGIGLFKLGVFDQKATNNDIDGNWNSTLATQSFVFIPKCNIDGLIITFSIRDKNNNELQTITKNIGDVKKGQQYTVSFNLSELQDFATLMDSNYTQLSVTGGTKKLIYTNNSKNA